MEETPPSPPPARKRRKILPWVLLGLAAFALGWFMRPYPEIDEARVHPALRGLDESAAVGWTSFGDGGTTVFHIKRLDGSTVQFCLSNSLDHSFLERGQLYVNASHYTEPGAVKVTGYDHTKFVVAKILEKSPDSRKMRGGIALMTKRPMDWLSFAAEKGLDETIRELRLPFFD